MITHIGVRPGYGGRRSDAVGKMMSSRIRKGWAPQEFPADRAAAERLREWLQESDGKGLDAVGLGFSTADLSGRSGDRKRRQACSTREAEPPCGLS